MMPRSKFKNSSELFKWGSIWLNQGVCFKTHLWLQVCNLRVKLNVQMPVRSPDSCNGRLWVFHLITFSLSVSCSYLSFLLSNFFPLFLPHPLILSSFCVCLLCASVLLGFTVRVLGVKPHLSSHNPLNTDTHITTHFNVHTMLPSCSHTFMSSPSPVLNPPPPIPTHTQSSSPPFPEPQNETI